MIIDWTLIGLVVLAVLAYSSLVGWVLSALSESRKRLTTYDAFRRAQHEHMDRQREHLERVQFEAITRARDPYAAVYRQKKP